MRMRPFLVLLMVTACTATTGESTTTTAAPASTSTPAVTTTSVGTATTTTSSPATTTSLDPAALDIVSFPVPAGSHPHDVAPAADGGVWYTAQGSGELGWLDPATGETVHVPLGAGSRPHGVIVDEEGTPWITDGGLNAIVSVDPSTREVTAYPLPDHAPDSNLNTAVFDADGVLWFTGQAGIYGWLEPSGAMEVRHASGRGPYGITATPQGDVFYASLAGSHVAQIVAGGDVTVVGPPTPEQGARRVWSDSNGMIWVSEWNSGQVSRYDPGTGDWAMWPLPGDDPAAYAVFVDDRDVVWLSDFSSNSIVRFDPVTEAFVAYVLPHQPGEVRQIHGRPGEVWGAESAADHLVLIRTG